MYRDAFGNAIGGSFVAGRTSSSYDEADFSVHEDARDAAMSRLVDAAFSSTSRYTAGQLGSGSFGVGGASGLTLASLASQGAGATAAVAPFVDFDEYDRMGALPPSGVVGAEAKQGAWGIAKSLAGNGANNADVNRIKNRLLTLNPWLAYGVQQGQRH